MNWRSVIHGSSAAALALALLSACNTARTLPLGQAEGERVSASGLPIAPNPRNERRLLFISDGSFAGISVYTLPDLKFKGHIYDRSVSQGGLCTDPDGSIWSADVYSVSHYSRTGAPLKTVTLPKNAFPRSCAFDRTTDTLAVTAVWQNPERPGSVLLYKHGEGIPRLLRGGHLIEHDFDAYDPAGDLFVDGLDRTGNFALAECPAHLQTCRAIALQVHYFYGPLPGSIAWYSRGNYLALTRGSIVYWVRISKSVGAVVGYTLLEDHRGTPQYGPSQLVFAGPGERYILGGWTEHLGAACVGKDHQRKKDSVDRWSFPSGLKPLGYTIGVCGPFGAAVSPAN